MWETTDTFKLNSFEIIQPLLAGFPARAIAFPLDYKGLE